MFLDSLNPKISLFFLVIIVVSATIGYLAYPSLSTLIVAKNDPTVLKAKADLKPLSELFTTESITVRATLTELNPTSITLKNEAGQSATFPVFSGVTVFIKTIKSPVAITSSDLGAVPVGKIVTVTLNIVREGGYQVTGISYFDATP